MVPRARSWASVCFHGSGVESAGAVLRKSGGGGKPARVKLCSTALNGRRSVFTRPGDLKSGGQKICGHVRFSPERFAFWISKLANDWLTKIVALVFRAQIAAVTICKSSTCTRQGSNLQHCDPKSYSVGSLSFSESWKIARSWHPSRGLALALPTIATRRSGR